VLQMSPARSASAPTAGLGDTKTFFRGFKDGTYNMTFDGIPFNDTNDPTHHSWVWFPRRSLGAQFSTAVLGTQLHRTGEFRWVDQYSVA